MSAVSETRFKHILCILFLQTLCMCAVPVLCCVQVKHQTSIKLSCLCMCCLLNLEIVFCSYTTPLSAPPKAQGPQVRSHLSLNSLLLNHVHVAHFQKEVPISRPIYYYWLKSGSSWTFRSTAECELTWLISALSVSPNSVVRWPNVFFWNTQYGF